MIFREDVIDENGVVIRATILAGYRSHDQRVLSTLNEEKLLTFDEKQGG